MKRSSESISYYVFNAFNIAITSLFALLAIIPFFFVISASVSSEVAVIKHGVTIFPKEFSLEAYKLIFTTRTFYNAFNSSVFVTVAGTAVSMLLTSMTAYVLSKKYLPYNRIISFLIYFTMLFSGGLVPFFLVVKNLHLIDSLWSLIIPAAINPWNMILLRNFFMEIPNELVESARIDGCSEARILFNIILPLSLPALATIGLFYAVGYWNQWFLAVVFINEKTKWPLQVLLRQLISMATATQAMQDDASRAGYVPPSESLKMATVIVATVPIVCVYPFLQKYFAKGLLIGAVKG